MPKKEVIPTDVSERLKKFRIASGLSRGQVADKIGCTTSAICYWENGKRQPDADTLIELIHLYNVHISQFFDEAPQEIELSQDEIDLISTYRKAPKECKKVIKMILKSYERE